MMPLAFLKNSNEKKGELFESISFKPVLSGAVFALIPWMCIKFVSLRGFVVILAFMWGIRVRILKGVST